jgi:ubiquinone/menaquinone biosynthesis C-methylase UbiE
MNVVEQEFDALAAEYENNRLASWYQAHADEMLQHCITIEEGDILDIGCGTGHFLREYLKGKPGLKAVGVDVSSSMIVEASRKAQEAGLENLKFIHADWESMSLAPLSGYNFNIIFCANAFHYFTDPQAASDKLYKLLSDGGMLYVLERNKARSLLTLFWGFLHSTFIKDQVVFYKNSELINFFEKSGFTGVRIIRSIKKYFWKNKIFTSIVLLEGKKSDAAENDSMTTGTITGKQGSK